MRQADRERQRLPDSPRALASALADAGLSRLLDLRGWSASESIGLQPKKPRSKSGRLVGASKFGGQPDLPADVAWPLSRARKPLSFLAQIRLADVARFPAAAALPPSGWLWFFADTADRGAEHPDGAVLHQPTARTRLQRASSPTDTELSVPATDEFVEHAIEFTRVLAVPEIPPRALTAPEQKAYWSLLNPDAIAHRLLGEPSRIQSPVLNRAKRTALLLQVDTDRRLDMSWGDNGRLFFVVPHAKLESAQFDECWLIMQSH